MRRIDRRVNANLTAPVASGPVSLAIWDRMGPVNYDLWEYVRTSMTTPDDWSLWIKMKKITSFPNDVLDAENDYQLEKFLK